MEVVANDAQAIHASLADPDAFALVFDRHFDAVYRFARRRAGAAIADDVAAETFVRAFEHRARYHFDRPDARPWLLGIAVNLLRRHRRQEQRQLRAYAHSGHDPVTGIRDDDSRLDAAAAAQEVARRIEELRPDERDVVLLYAWADLSYDQIAEALDVPVGTVRSRLSRARAKVNEGLAGTRHEPPKNPQSLPGGPDG